MSDDAAAGTGEDEDDATSATTVLVTGAGHGLGLEVARQLAEGGAQVMLGARSARTAQQAARGLDGVTALPADLDLTDTDSVRAAAEAVEARFGRLDVLVNNAAAHPDMSETVSNADLRAAIASFDITLFGTWRVTQAFLPLLRRSAHPRIVNVSSGAGSHTDEKYGIPKNSGRFASHGIAKAALNALTATLAAELEPTPVMVNAVCPGVTVPEPSNGPPGARTPAASAPGVVWAATLPDDGPRGGFFRDGRPVGW